MILLNDGTVFPQEQLGDLNRLMTEEIGFIYAKDNAKELISSVIGKDVDIDSIYIEEKTGVAHVPLKDITPYIRGKIRLAQQFSRLIITNQ